jgi:prepilin-type processing-associated H-X9-DG protein
VLIGDFTWLDNWDESVPTDFPDWHARRRMHNLAFLDGHVTFTKVRKGIHVDPNYTLVPCTTLRSRFVPVQQEIP